MDLLIVMIWFIRYGDGDDEGDLWSFIEEEEEVDGLVVKDVYG